MDQSGNMPDVHSPPTRSRNMAAIRGRDTKPELLVRKGLHARGFRFRLHNKTLPGRPDLSLPKYRAIIFINGCFWHGHNCPMFRVPETRTGFWLEKLRANAERDRLNTCRLQEMNIRIATVWECALKGPAAPGVETSLQALSVWIPSDAEAIVLKGTQAGDGVSPVLLS